MNKLTKTAFLLLTSLSFLGCTIADVNMKLMGNEPQVKEPYQSSDLEYLDSSQFDNTLSIAMNKEHAEIEVTLVNSFSVNNIPKRIDAWLTVIGEEGGEVDVEPAESERNIVGIVLALYSVYRLIKKQNRYAPAKNYNAKLLYRRNANGEAMVEKMVFSRKEN